MEITILWNLKGCDMIMFADLIKGDLFRVYEGHMCFRMFYIGKYRGEEYFSENKNAPITECDYFRKWESINE